MTQGKTHTQIKFSTIMVLIGFIGITLTLVWGLTLFPDQETAPHGSPDEYWFPVQNDTLTKQDSLELKEPDAIYYDTSNTDNMLDIDMDCGGNDPIVSYDRMIDVPAGADSIIMVDGIVYKDDKDKKQWVPLYPDEHVMWIGSNGDTIWE